MNTISAVTKLFCSDYGLEDFFISKAKIETNIQKAKNPLRFRADSFWDINFKDSKKLKDPFDALVKLVSRRYVTPRLIKGREKELLSEIAEKFRPRVFTLTSPEHFASYFTGSDEPFCLENRFESVQDKTTVICGFVTERNGKLRKRSWNRGNNGKNQLIDYDYILSERLILTKIEEKLKKELSKEDYTECPVFAYLMKRLKKVMSSFSLCELNPTGSDNFINDYLRKYEAEGDDSFPKDFTLKMDALNKENFRLLLFLTNCIFKRMDLKYIYKRDGDFGTISPYVSFELVRLFLVLKNEYDLDKQSFKYYREIEKTGAKARVFEDKKYCTKEVRKKAASSCLNKWFGKVELDATTDIMKFSDVEDGFLELAKIIFLTPQPDHAVRFRMLGHHHAAGLYFPGLRCLCVDLRTTDSAAHELFHLIDYTSGSLSRHADFMKVLNLYKEEVRKKVDASGPAIKRLFDGKTKFNRSYYYEPTEVFARCGELYLTRTLKFMSPLCTIPSATGFAYPESENLKKEIDTYFNALMERRKEKYEEYLRGNTL